jgi:Smg protein
MNGTVLDILIYVFDRYMFDEAPEVPEREALARDLESAGFGEANVERALDWLADLAGERHRPDLGSAEGSAASSAAGSAASSAVGAAAGGNAPHIQSAALRIYSPLELSRLSVDCRGLLLSLENADILKPGQRELVIDRLLALDVEDLTLDQVRWVVLMVLSSQPGQEQACARMETLVFDSDTAVAH